jgi:putative Mn2+ efflux pump MntP
MKTLEIKTISNKVGKYAHLIGGILMLLIGVLMLFKPDWLMLNF